MSKLTNKKDPKEFNKVQSNSGSEINGEAAGSLIYEAGKAYYEYLRSSKSQSHDNNDDYSTAFMMF